MALRYLLLIQPKLLLIGASGILIALALSLVLDSGSALAGGDCVTILTGPGAYDFDEVCSGGSLWDEVSIWHQVVYSWNFYFG